MLLRPRLTVTSPKKVVLRDDDVRRTVDPALRWLSGLISREGARITYGVVPAVLEGGPEVVEYLRGLDPGRFELATHGLGHKQHELLAGPPYDAQLAIVEEGTRIIERCFGRRPTTFIPPFHRADQTTTQVLAALGYHSISSGVRVDRSAVWDETFVDFSWERTWEPLVHRTFSDFKTAFDKFLGKRRSSTRGDLFVSLLHHSSFLDEEGRLRSVVVADYEKSLAYARQNGVEFMTVEDAYRSKVDAARIDVRRMRGGGCSVDLTGCEYEQALHFARGRARPQALLVRDLSAARESEQPVQGASFVGKPGRVYEVFEVAGSEPSFTLPGGRRTFRA